MLNHRQAPNGQCARAPEQRFQPKTTFRRRHGGNLSGGKVAGDPNMPIVANVTPHETGLKGWTEADFIRSLREGRRKDGTEILPQMPWKAYGQMSDTELKALWAYLQTVPAVEKGDR